MATASSSEPNVTLLNGLVRRPGGQLGRQKICVVVQPFNFIGPSRLLYRMSPIRAAKCSATMAVGRLVGARMITGKMEASHT